jgi:hypothetical protein
MSVQGSQSFDKYFRTFQANGEKAQRYQLILSSGHVISGVPVAVAGSDFSGSFDVRLDNGENRPVAWKSLLTASPIG